MKFRVSQVAFIAFILAIAFPTKSAAVPQFARRYNLKCFACHTICCALRCLRDDTKLVDK